MKNYIITFIYLSLGLICVSQEISTTYYNKYGDRVNDTSDAYYYRNIHFDTIIQNKNIYQLSEYYTQNNQIKRIALTTSNEPPFRFFKEKQEYYADGSIKSLEKFHISGRRIDTAFYCYPSNKIKLISFSDPKDLISGKTKYLAAYDSTGKSLLQNGNGFIRSPLETLTWEHKDGDYEEGNIFNYEKHGIWKGIIHGEYTFEEEYVNGSLSKGKTTSSDGKTTQYSAENLNQTAEYKGGNQALLNFIANNYIFPTEALHAKVKGVILVTFIVEKDGTISNIKALNDLGYRTRENAIKVVQKLKKFTPGTNRGIPIATTFSLPINLE